MLSGCLLHTARACLAEAAFSCSRGSGWLRAARERRDCYIGSNLARFLIIRLERFASLTSFVLAAAESECVKAFLSLESIKSVCENLSESRIAVVRELFNEEERRDVVNLDVVDCWFHWNVGGRLLFHRQLLASAVSRIILSFFLYLSFSPFFLISTFSYTRIY